MKKSSRYDTPTLIEAQFEPGSRGRVLKNLLGIKSKAEMDRVEAEALKRTVDAFVRACERSYRFTASGICKIHKVWLGGIYEWAGNYRKINLSKGKFTLASAMQIPTLMEEFEKGPLYKQGPALGAGSYFSYFCVPEWAG
ncbi:MAG: Fic family protein [Proteobacteria bacterium]|nr:Fic family protein [Pseudomonadota bacterium]